MHIDKFENMCTYLFKLESLLYKLENFKLAVSSVIFFCCWLSASSENYDTENPYL